MEDNMSCSSCSSSNSTSSQELSEVSSGSQLQTSNEESETSSHDESNSFSAIETPARYENSPDQSNFNRETESNEYIQVPVELDTLVITDNEIVIVMDQNTVDHLNTFLPNFNELSVVLVRVERDEDSATIICRLVNTSNPNESCINNETLIQRFTECLRQNLETNLIVQIRRSEELIQRTSNVISNLVQVPQDIVEDNEEKPIPVSTVIERCTICLSNFKMNDILRRLPCLHEFHVTCVDSWFSNAKLNCPNCRFTLSENQLINSTIRSYDPHVNGEGKSGNSD